MPPKSSKREKAFEYNPALDLKPGRHECECQARVHELIRNCLGCGRVVCKQEGSGPCFTCGTLVCTKEEREIIESGTKKGNALMNQLMGGKQIGPNLKNVAENINDAIAYRDKLLIADADSERRTKVNDLQSDYLNLESNSYLTLEEREAILERKAELRQMRNNVRKNMVVDFDFVAGKVVEQKERPIEVASDPVLQSILQLSNLRMKDELAQIQSNPNTKTISCDQFTPSYDVSKSKLKKTPKVADVAIEDVFGENDEAFYADIEQKGYCLALDQPLASFVVGGVRKHIPVKEDIRFTGPMLIAATTNSLDEKIIKDEEIKARKRFKDAKINFPTEYSTGALLGRVFVEDCYTWKEYSDEFGKNAECYPKEGFVIFVTKAEQLPSAIPHIPSNELYQINSGLRKTIQHLLDPYFIG
uniref:Zinc finger C2HC5-type domain-containing protein n=1 Tax=Panagrolaimus superbus TaxID=310955 RepID=A0A914Y0F7_9BILA